MGICFSLAERTGRSPQYLVPEVCEIQRLPPQLLATIFGLLPQSELLCIVPQVCKSWHQLAHQSALSLTLNLSNSTRQLLLPQLLYWMESNGQQLQQLQLSTSKPLGPIHRRALLRSLAVAQPSVVHDLALQLDLDVRDVEFITQQICSYAPMLRTLKLQPVKPSPTDLQLLVLACILGNLVGADTPGPVLPHLTDCSSAVQQLAATATQLQSLSLSRYQIGDTDCVSAATQLTGLCLQHCNLSDNSLRGLTALTRLKKLELSDNQLTTGALGEIAVLQQLTRLDLSVMPSIARMRGSITANLASLSQLQCLQELNIVGLGITDACALSTLTNLTCLEIGLNPLSARSLRVIGQLQNLQRLELGGISQAWVLSSGLPPLDALREQDVCWYGLTGLQSITYLDLGGSNFSAAVWVCHVCPTICSMPRLKQLQLAHCHIPGGKLLQLLVGLRRHTPASRDIEQILDLNIDRCSLDSEELQALVQLTSLTRLSLVSMSPRLGDKQAASLAHLSSLRSLCVRNNDLRNKGVERLVRGLVHLTCLDWADNAKVGKRLHKQYGHLKAAAEAVARVDLDGSHV